MYAEGTMLNGSASTSRPQPQPQGPQDEGVEGKLPGPKPMNGAANQDEGCGQHGLAPSANQSQTKYIAHRG